MSHNELLLMEELNQLITHSILVTLGLPCSWYEEMCSNFNLFDIFSTHESNQTDKSILWHCIKDRTILLFIWWTVNESSCHGNGGNRTAKGQPVLSINIQQSIEVQRTHSDVSSTVRTPEIQIFFPRNLKLNILPIVLDMPPLPTHFSTITSSTCVKWCFMIWELNIFFLSLLFTSVWHHGCII